MLSVAKLTTVALFLRTARSLDSSTETDDRIRTDDCAWAACTANSAAKATQSVARMPTPFLEALASNSPKCDKNTSNTCNVQVLFLAYCAYKTDERIGNSHW